MVEERGEPAWKEGKIKISHRLRLGRERDRSTEKSLG